tara:strand:- start:3397 stop:6882 length:3486 start_codon:yes stop_codon:yes gene_type:complete
MTYERFKPRTRINTNLPDYGAGARQQAAELQKQSESWLNLSSSFFGQAIQEGKEKGTIAGQNAVVMNPDGTVSRKVAPEGAGQAYVKAFQAQSRQAYQSSMAMALKNKAAGIVEAAKHNPEAALEAIEKNFRPFAEKLVQNAGKDLEGVVKLQAESSLQALTNSVQVIMAERAFEENKTIVTAHLENQKNTLATIHQQGIEPDEIGEEFSNFQMFEGEYLGNLHEARSNGIIDHERYLADLKEYDNNRIGGQLLYAVKADLDAGDVVGATNRVMNLTDNPVEGRDAKDMAEIVSMAEKRIKDFVHYRTLKEKRDDKYISKHLAAIGPAVDDLERDERGTPAEIKKLFAPLLAWRDHPKVQTAYMKAMKVEEKQIEDAVKVTQKTIAISHLASVKNGTMSIDRAKTNLLEGLYGRGKEANAFLKELEAIRTAKIKKYKTETEKKDKEQYKNYMMRLWRAMVADDLVTLADIDDWAANDNWSRWGEFARNETNRNAMKTAFNEFDTVRFGNGTYSKKKSRDPKNQDYWKATLQEKNLAPDSDLAKLDPAAIHEIIQDPNIKVSLPDFFTDIFKSWKVYAHDQETIVKIAEAAKALHARGIVVPGMSQADVLRIEKAAQTADSQKDRTPGAWDRLSKDLVVPTEEVDQRKAAAEKFVADPKFMNLLDIQLRKMGDEAGAWDRLLNANTKFFGGIEGQEFVGTGVLDKNVSIQQVPESVLAQIKKHYIIERTSGDGSTDQELALQLAVKAVEASGGGLTEYEGGGAKFSRLTLENVAKDLKVKDPAELIRALLLNQKEKITNIIKDKAARTDLDVDDKLTADNFFDWFDLWDVDNDLLDFITGIVTLGFGGEIIQPIVNAWGLKAQFGIFEGGDAGETLWDQIGDKGRFAQAIREDRVIVQPDDVSQKTFSIGLQLGDKKAGLIWLRNVRFDEEEIETSLKEEWGSLSHRIKHFLFNDPTLTNFVAPAPKYDMSGAEPTKAQLGLPPDNIKPEDLMVRDAGGQSFPLPVDPDMAPEDDVAENLDTGVSVASPTPKPASVNVDAMLKSFAMIESSGGKNLKNMEPRSTATGIYQVTDGTATGTQDIELVKLGLKPAKSNSIEDKNAYALERFKALLTYFNNDLDKVAVAWNKGFSGAKKWDGQLRSLTAKERNYVKKFRKEYKKRT